MSTTPIPDIAVVPMGKTIPRIIHQAYHGKKLPEALRQLVDTLCEQNPTWEHRLYDDAELSAWIEEHYGPAVASYYDRIDSRYGAARIDFWRYLLIYKIGGIYIDIKSTFSRPIDEVIRADDQFLLSSWPQDAYEQGYGVHARLSHRSRGEYQQWHVIGVPGHPFLRAVIMQVMANIDRYNPWRDGVSKFAVVHTTGPVPYTLAIEPLIDTWPHREVADERDLALVYNPLAGENYQKYLPMHYTRLKIPLIKPSTIGHYLYYIRIIIKDIYVAIKGLFRRSRR
jgi:mannosyltransferase OCH1-like enzyme